MTESQLAEFKFIYTKLIGSSRWFTCGSRVPRLRQHVICHILSRYMLSNSTMMTRALRHTLARFGRRQEHHGALSMDLSPVKQKPAPRDAPKAQTGRPTSINHSSRWSTIRASVRPHSDTRHLHRCTRRTRNTPLCRTPLQRPTVHTLCRLSNPSSGMAGT